MHLLEYVRDAVIDGNGIGDEKDAYIFSLVNIRCPTVSISVQRDFIFVNRLTQIAAASDRFDFIRFFSDELRQLLCYIFADKVRILRIGPKKLLQHTVFFDNDHLKYLL